MAQFVQLRNTFVNLAHVASIDFTEEEVIIVFSNHERIRFAWDTLEYRLLKMEEGKKKGSQVAPTTYFVD